MVFDTSVVGHVVIRDQETKEVLAEFTNAINFEAMSLAIARSMANKTNGPIFRMAFGNGGSSIDSLGVITYLEPNIIGINATLYNETFAKIVDDNSVQNLNTVENNIVVEHEDSKFFSDIVVTATLDFGEPAGQQAFDTSIGFTSDFVFDELGLKTENDMLITHVIFHPIQKSLNRIIEIIYSLRISIC